MSSVYKKIYSKNDDDWKNAYLNWRMSYYDQRHNFKVMADGYLRSAISLLKICLDDNTDKKADGLIFPVIFNSDHGIELYLKTIIWTLNMLLQDFDKDFNDSHDLISLYQTADQYAKKYLDKEDYNGYGEMMRNVHAYINELAELSICEIDGNGRRKLHIDFPRYPMGTKEGKTRKAYFYADDVSDNVVIDLENYSVRLKKIQSDFDTVYGWLEICCDRMMEYFADCATV